MCRATVAKVIEVENSRAICDFDGVLSEVSAAMFPHVQPNDNVIIHSGFISDIVKDMKKLFYDILSTDSLALQCLDAIERENKKFTCKKIKLLIFEGPHEDAINRYGLAEFLPKNIEFVTEVTSNIEKENFFALKSAFRKVDSQGLILPHYMNENIDIKSFEDLCMKYDNVFACAKYEPIDILKAILSILTSLNEKESFSDG